MTLRHFEVGIKGTDHTSIIAALSSGKAKYEYWARMSEAWGLYRNEAKDLWKRITCHVAGGPSRSQAERLASTAERRGLPFVRIGMRVECDGKPGRIVGSNDSGNFDVMFENGHVGNCHPAWRMRYYSGDTVLWDSEARS